MTAIFVTVSLIHVFLSFIEKRSTQTLKQQSMPKYVMLMFFGAACNQIDLNIAFLSASMN